MRVAFSREYRICFEQPRFIAAESRTYWARIAWLKTVVSPYYKDPGVFRISNIFLGRKDGRQTVG